MDVQQATATDLREEDSATSLIFGRDAENPAVCVVDGYGIQITTRSGRLVVSDGIGRQRRERTYNRATHGLSRLVIMATTGHITVEAYRWLDQLGIGLAMLDPATGEVTSATTRVANDDARLRRAQALATGTSTGLDIAKYLIGLKLTGQAAVARHELSSPEAAETIDQLVRSVDQSSSLEEVRQFEASAANLYWLAWCQVEARFVKADAVRVPGNWLRFEGRRSAVTPGTARNATDPINALLNLSYCLVEAEGHLATIAVGLDPGMGILHADLKGRASFVLDLIEAVRPLADLHVLRLVKTHPLRWRDFHEDARGVVRVLSPLTHRLAEGMPGYAASLAPVTEQVARMLAEASPYDVATPSTLTREKHKVAARRRVQGGKEASPLVGPSHAGMSPRKKNRQRPPAEHEPSLPLPICKGCGAGLAPEPDRPRRRGAYCPSCLAKRRKEVGATLGGQSARTSADLVVRTGVRPTHTPEAKAARHKGNVAQRAEQVAWEAEHAGEVWA
jgi:CRISPR-associated endonuclease Cas1